MKFFVFQAEFDIPEASYQRTKKKILQTMGERWRQFKSDLTSKWALAADKESVEDTVCEKYDISKKKWAPILSDLQRPPFVGGKFVIFIVLNFKLTYCYTL